MANFAETQPIEFSKLAPYPVELYTKVGVMKQAMYDANTAKVQSYYDSIAGLDVAKPEDKAYLNQKLTQLQTDLSHLSGADFSKQSVVNQAGAMAGPIAKDPNILAGVMSTAQMRKWDKEMEKARTEGKNGPENDWDYGMGRNAWMTDGKVGSSFNASYMQYQDVTKKLVEGFRAANVNITEQDIAFNPDGTLNDAVIREKVKGMTPQQIKNIVGATLDNRDYKQLDISSRYKLQGKTPLELSDIITKYQKASEEQLLGKWREMNYTASTSSGPIKASLQSNMQQLEEAMKTTRENTARYIQDITDGKLESVKSEFGTTSFIDRFAHGMSYGEYSKTYTVTPQETQKWRVQQEIDIKKWEREQNRADRAEDRQWWEVQHPKTATDKDPKNPPTIPGGIGNVTTTVPYTNITKQLMEEGIRADRAALATSKAKMIQKYGKDEAWYNKQRELWDAGAYTNLDATMKQHFKDREVDEGRLDSREYTYGNILLEADKQYPFKMTDLPVHLQTLQTVDNAGKPIVYTADEVVSLRKKVTDFDKAYMSRTQAEKEADAPKGQYAPHPDRYMKLYPTLTPREQLLFDRAKIGVGRKYVGGPDASGQYNAITFQTDAQFQQISAGKDKFITDALQRTTGLGATVHLGLAKKAEEAMEMSTMVSAIAADMERNKQDFGDEASGNKKKLRDLRKVQGGTDLTYSLAVQRGAGVIPDQYNIIVSGTPKGASSTESVYMPLTGHQKNDMVGPNFEHGPAGAFQTAVDMRLLETGNGTTNPRGIADNEKELKEKTLKNTYLKKVHFPQVGIFAVKGDMRRGETENSLDVVLYVNQPLSSIYNPNTGRTEQLTPGWRTVHLNNDNMMDYGMISQALSQLTDAQIYERVYGFIPTTPQQLQQVREAATRR